MNRLRCADVVIVGRGGGSLEDLWAFNEEIVARAVAASRIPVISAVGHETDFTICDFAADSRAPTPSAAAELAVPDCAELMGALEYRNARLKKAVGSKLEEARKRLDALAKSRVLQNPAQRLEMRKMELDRMVTALAACMGGETQSKKARLSKLCGKLDALSPLAVLSRGYAILYGEDGSILSHAGGARLDERIRVRMDGGTLGCVVREIMAQAETTGKAGTKSHE
jgi:exodeoxyribonuclease VII large subunit